MAQLARFENYHHLANEQLGELLKQTLRQRLIRPADPTSWPFAAAARTLETEAVVLLFNGTDADHTAAFSVAADIREVVVLDPEAQDHEARPLVRGVATVRVAVPAGRSRILRLCRECR